MGLAQLLHVPEGEARGTGTASNPPPIHSYRVYCLLGDGELSEGSVWEAMAFASIYKLDNLVAILDINRLGQSDPAPLQHQMDVYQKRCEAFGYVRGSYLKTLIAKETSMPAAL